MVSLFKSRFAPRKFLHQLLFTDGLAPFIEAELGIVLPTRWPLNRNALVEWRFGWPYELLFHLAKAVVGGAKLAHGDVLRAGGETLAGFDAAIPEWLLVRSQAVESARSAFGGAVPLLLLSPVVTKKRYKGGKDAVLEAGKRAAYKWERLHVPLPGLTPLGDESLVSP